jgi:hypothetical protein
MVIASYRFALEKFYQLSEALSFLDAPNELRIDVAQREKVKAPVHCAATSIRVELW